MSLPQIPQVPQGGDECVHAVTERVEGGTAHTLGSRVLEAGPLGAAALGLLWGTLLCGVQVPGYDPLAVVRAQKRRTP